MGPIWSGYIGLALMGTMFMAVGMFFSATTKNQIIAAILTFVFLMTLQLIGFATRLTDTWYASVLKYISLPEHMENFQKGIIDSRDLVYYLSFAALFIFLTVRLIEGRKWK
jgi:ABC-2 type transport system permease protein